MNKVLKGQTSILTIESLTITLSAFQSKTFPLQGLPNGVFLHFFICVPFGSPRFCFQSTEYFVLCLLCQLNMPGQSIVRSCVTFFFFWGLHSSALFSIERKNRI